MARGRMINTTIALDPEFNAMSTEAQLLFLRTVPHLDRDGLMIGQPTALWAKIAPLQLQLLEVMPAVIDEWQYAGLIEVFDTKIGPVLYFTSFHDNQIGLRYERETASQIPIPVGLERTAEGIRQVSGNVPEGIRQVSGENPPKGEGEGEGERELEGEERTASPAADKHALIYSMWMQNMPGTMTDLVREQIDDVIQETNTDAVIEGIKIAVSNNKRTLRYVRGCALRECSGQGTPGKEQKRTQYGAGVSLDSVQKVREMMQEREASNGHIDVPRKVIRQLSANTRAA